MTPMLITLATFSCFIWFGGRLNATIVFGVITSFFIIQRPITLFVQFQVDYANAIHCLKRITDFLIIDELDCSHIERIHRDS